MAGEFDLVAVVRVRQHDDLADVVTGEIAPLDGITHTQTLVAFRAYSRADTEALFAIGTVRANPTEAAFAHSCALRHTSVQTVAARPEGRAGSLDG